MVKVGDTSVDVTIGSIEVERGFNPPGIITKKNTRVQPDTRVKQGINTARSFVRDARVAEVATGAKLIAEESGIKVAS